MKHSLRNFKKIAASILVLFQLLSSSLVMANAVADPLTTISNRPIVLDKLGTDIVEIATPNSSGISYNKYLKFDVNSRGLILNNSSRIVDTNIG